MISRFFYNGLIRKYILAFGACFDHIYVVRFDNDDNEVNRVIVPFRYAQREKWDVRNEQDPDFIRKYAMLYPRMAFEITGFNFDASRQISPLNYTLTFPAGVENPSEAQQSYAAVPYTIAFNLYITAKSVDEASQIVEQILPFFSPTWSVTVPLTPVDSRIIPINLAGTRSIDTYDGNFKERRVIEWTFSFDMKAYFVGPANTVPVITSTSTNVGTGSGSGINIITGGTTWNQLFADWDGYDNVIPTLKGDIVEDKTLPDGYGGNDIT